MPEVKTTVYLQSLVNTETNKVEMLHMSTKASSYNISMRYKQMEEGFEIEKMQTRIKL